MESLAADSDYDDIEWLILNAIRQTFGIAYNSPISYEDAIARIRELAPRLIRDSSPIVDAFESPLVRFYRSRARARSRIEDKHITALEIVRTEIRQLEEELYEVDEDQGSLIEMHISQLQQLLKRLDELNWTETQAITRDAQAPEGEQKLLDKGPGYREYAITANAVLRVRVLHPDPPEAQSGVDLVYETHENDMVRLTTLQYKMWNGRALYTSQTPNLPEQLERMRRVFCTAGICKPPDNRYPDSYRLPFCAAFLRPTDKQQTKSAWRTTHAWHIPICKAVPAFKSTSQGYLVLHANNARSNSLTQDPFQELYTRGMLGSRWLNESELNDLYDQMGIFGAPAKIIIHAQEYWRSGTPGNHGRIVKRKSHV